MGFTAILFQKITQTNYNFSPSNLLWLKLLIYNKQPPCQCNKALTIFSTILKATRYHQIGMSVLLNLPSAMTEKLAKSRAMLEESTAAQENLQLHGWM